MAYWENLSQTIRKTREVENMIYEDHPYVNHKIPKDGLSYNPTHYSRYPMEPAEFIIRNRITGGASDIIQYASRYREKGGADDLMKIIKWATLLLKYEYARTVEFYELPKEDGR